MRSQHDSERALSLKGGNYATVGGSHSLPTAKPDGSFTVEAWVRPDESGGTFISKYDTRLNGGFMFGMLKSGHLEFALQSASGSMNALKTQRQLKPLEWSYVAASFGEGEMSVFINGTLDSHQEAAGVSMAIDTQMLIGAFFGERDGTDAPKSLFSGSIDEIKVWNGARDIKQIRDDITRTPEHGEKDLVAYWPCDEPNGDLTDSTGNHHATLAFDAKRRSPGAPTGEDFCDCSERGDCIDLTCSCANGYYGHHCERSHCPKNCSGHGVCNTLGVCECAVGFAGPACAEVTCRDGCSGHGLCHFQWPHFSCICDAGWVGDTCSKADASGSALLGEFGVYRKNSKG